MKKMEKNKEFKRFIKNLKRILVRPSVLDRLEEAYEIAKDEKSCGDMMDIALQIYYIERQEK